MKFHDYSISDQSKLKFKSGFTDENAVPDFNLFNKLESTYCVTFLEVQVRFRYEIFSLGLQTPLTLVALEAEAAVVAEANLIHQCTWDS